MKTSTLFPASVLSCALLAALGMSLRYRAALTYGVDRSNSSAPAGKVTRPMNAEDDLLGTPTLPATPAQQEAQLKRLRSLLAQTDPLARDRALLVLLDHLDPGGFPRLLDACRDLGVSPEAEVYRLLLTAWAGREPHAAIIYAGSGISSLKAVITGWTTTDAEAALSWLFAHPMGKTTDALLPLVLPTLARMNPARATEMLAHVNPGPRLVSLRGIAADIMARGGDAALREWLHAIPDGGESRMEAMTALLQTLPKDRPQEAMKWLKDYPDLISADGRNTAVRDIFMQWAVQDFPAARAALGELPVGSAAYRASLFGLVGSEHTATDPQCVVELLDLYPQGEVDSPGRASLLSAAVAMTCEADPELALSLLGRLPAEDEENHYFYPLALRAWAKKDPAAMVQWLQSHELPPLVREQVEEFERDLFKKAGEQNPAAPGE